jgi:hypothetical protein
VIVPQTNVDVFRHRPVHEVAAVLPDEQTAVDACRELQDAGITITEAQILHGPEGARILDINGDQHGYTTRVLRAIQKLGYDQTFLAIYDEALHRGQAVLTVGCSHAVTRPVAQLLDARGGHAIVWFGRGTAEQLSSR